MFNQAGWLCVMKTQFASPMCALLTEGRNHSTAVTKRKLLRNVVAVFSLLRLPASGVAASLVVRPPFAHTPGAALRTLDLRVTFSGSRSARSVAQPRQGGVAIIASSLSCCDSPAPWQGRRDLWGIYRLLRCIIDFLLSFVCTQPRHCVLKQLLPR